MRLGLKNTLASIAAIGVIGFYGCEYQLSQSERDSVTEKAFTTWVDTTDNYLEIHRLLKRKEYKKANTLLKGYLQHELKRGQITEEALKSGSFNISSSLLEESVKRIDEQVKKIDSSLR